MGAINAMQQRVEVAEYDKQVAALGLLEIRGHVEIGIHARLEDGQAAEHVDVGGLGVVGVVVEGTGDRSWSG